MQKMPNILQSSIITVQRASQSWLSRVLPQRQPTVVLNETELKRELQQLLSTIAHTLFAPFAALVAEQPEFSDTAESKEAAKQSTLDSIVETFKTNVVFYLSKSTSQNGAQGFLGNSSSQDATQVLLGYYHRSVGQYISFKSFAARIKAAFPQTQDEVKTVAELLPQVTHAAETLARAETHLVIGCIACALQDIIITALPRFYLSTFVHPSAKESMETLLKVIHAIRDKYDLHTSNVPLRTLETALRELNRQTAVANRRIWLPFRSLVTAPLAAEEDLKLYARNTGEVEILAKQISRGDGVFLITGYRGVGKSTFIYEALSKLPQVQKYDSDEYLWQVVPISVNLAKASGVTNILRLCIRRLYEAFTNEDKEHSDVITSLTKDVGKLLTPEERDHLLLAHLRAVWKVNVQRGESVKTLKQMGLDAGMNLNLGSLFTPVVGGTVAGLFPSFGMNAKMSKEWSKGVDTSVALPDYDEDKAEEDIVRFIKMLATRQPQVRGKKRIKLVFVFDEMDKMEVGEQMDLAKQLKNLFLERHTVFLLVTSKEFYYRWWEQRKVEDAVLGSYFSWVKTVPLFTSKETFLLLERLIQIDASNLNTNTSTALSEQEKTFVTTLARYLTYRARGIPRDIIRELQTMQLWLQGSPQTYITDQFGQYPAVVVYAEIQKILESLFDYTNTNTTGTASTSGGPMGSAASSASPTSSTSTPSAESTFMPEHSWTNEGRKEQVTHGLYIIIEELLDRGGLELNPDGELFKEICAANLKMVLPQDFKLLLDRLADRLKNIGISVGPTSSLAAYFPDYTANTELKIFSVPSLPSPTTGTFQRLDVAAEFYRMTGRPVTIMETDTRAKDATLSPEEIDALLKGNEQVRLQGAINALQKMQRPFLQSIYDQLCRIFMAEQNLPLRLSTIGVQDGAFFDSLRRLDQGSLTAFIDNETNVRLLQEFVRLIRLCCTGTDADKDTSDFGTGLLRRLLERHIKALSDSQASSLSSSSSENLSSFFGPTAAIPVPFPVPFPSPSPNSKIFPESLLIDIISTLANVTNVTDHDVLLLALQSLDRSRDIPDALIPPLKMLEEKSQSNLIELLVSLDFAAVSLATLQTLLLGRDPISLMNIWEHVIENKSQGIAQRVLAVLVQQIMEPSQSNPIDQNTNKVLAWLKGTNWDEVDQAILDAAKDISRNLIYQLQRAAPDQSERISHEKPVPVVNAPSSLPPASSASSVSSVPWYRSSGLLVTLSLAVILYVYFFVVPFDVPSNASLVTHVMIRLLEALYVYGLAATLLCIILSLSVLPNRDRFYLIGMLIAGGITVGCFFAQIYFYPFTATLLGQVILVLLLIGIIVVPIIVYNRLRKPVT